MTRQGLHAPGLGFALAVLAALALRLVDRPLLAALRAEGAVLEAALRYTPLWAPSFPFLVSMVLLNGVFRAHGQGIALTTAAVASVGAAQVGGFGAATRVKSLAAAPLLALSAGIGPVVGQNWGAERQDRARAALGRCLWASLGYRLAVALLLGAFARPVGTAFGADVRTFGDGSSCGGRPDPPSRASGIGPGQQHHAQHQPVDDVGRERHGP